MRSSATRCPQFLGRLRSYVSNVAKTVQFSPRSSQRVPSGADRRRPQPLERRSTREMSASPGCQQSCTHRPAPSQTLSGRGGDCNRPRVPALGQACRPRSRTTAEYCSLAGLPRLSDLAVSPSTMAPPRCCQPDVAHVAPPLCRPAADEAPYWLAQAVARQPGSIRATHPRTRVCQCATVRAGRAIGRPYRNQTTSTALPAHAKHSLAAQSLGANTPGKDLT